MRFRELAAIIWLTLTVVLAPAHAEKRAALVIGNDRYANLPDREQLRKAVNDAQAVGRALKQIGFDVIVGENLGRSAMVDRLGELVQRLGPGDTAFFFFSGHGVALDGVNYILPADVPDLAAGQAGQETRLKGAALTEQYIVSELAARRVRVAVVVLDACRTNPFARPGARGIGGEKGLAPPEQVRGVFSLYAASSGQAARDRLSDDDRNPNSVFTRVLAPALTRPGIDLASLAIDVREQVAQIAESAGYDQRPSYYDETIGGRVYLAGPPPANTGNLAMVAPPPPVAPPVSPPVVPPVAPSPPAPSGSSEPIWLATYGSWGAYTATPDRGKVCFAIARPTTAQTSPPNQRRDDAWMLISSRPAERVRDEISIIFGYGVKPGTDATIEIAGRSYAMLTKEDGAWVRNVIEEPGMIEALRRSRDATVKGTSAKGAVSTDVYQLKGLAQALDRVAQECR